MPSNRRTFLAAAGAPALALGQPAPAAPPSRIFVNHVGFLPAAGKRFVITNPPDSRFRVLRVTNPGKLTLTPIFEGRLQARGPDLGTASVGDFSAVKEEGIYRIACGDLESRHVIVYSRVYEYPQRVLFNYFPSQRCGDSRTGYRTPCHTRDARRVDNHEHVDVAGGWHMSGDLRKWILGTPCGVLGLTRLGARSLPWDRGAIDEELRWGNQYFLKMIRPDGGLMDHVVLPLGWQEERQLYANDAPLPAFYLTITAEAALADYYRGRDLRYAKTCLDAARTLWAYVHGPRGPRSYQPPVVPPYHDFLRQWFDQHYPGSALNVGDRLYTALRLHKVTGEREFLDAACADATALADLQVGGDVARNPAAACFREAPGKRTLAFSAYYGWFGPLGLCEILERVTRHPDRSRWLEAVQRIAAQHCLMSEKNPWGLLPACWYADDPGGGRRAGDGWYKYFYQHFRLRFGVNHEILGASLFLSRAAKVLGDPRCLDVAGRQIDWILGVNPFDMSTVEGIGYNQTERLISAEFFPPPPQIPGGVMVGIIGDKSDEPLQRGSASCEYDMPPTSLLMLLLGELQDSTGA